MQKHCKAMMFAKRASRLGLLAKGERLMGSSLKDVNYDEESC
jgi:hypothetical protein